MAVWIRRYACALAVLLVSTSVASAQVFTHPAPLGTTQSLAVFGNPVPGETVGVQISGSPGDVAFLLVGTAQANIPSPYGPPFLVDPASMVFPILKLPLGPTGSLQISTAWPALPVGTTWHAQVGLLDLQGTVTFTNLVSASTLAGASIAIDSPQANAIVNVATPTVSGTLSGGSLIDLATLTVDVGGTPAPGVTATAMGFSVTLPSLANGMHTVTASVDTTSGTTLTDSVTFQVSTGGGTTTVQGLLLDPQGFLPIVGAQVFIQEGGPSVLTDSAGFYQILNAPTGTVHVEFDPTNATLPMGATYSYPRYIRPINVVSGAVNQIDPCYLPRVDPIVTFQALETQGVFNCAQARFLQPYTLTNTTLGVSVQIPVNTIVVFPNNAAACTQSLSIANVNVQFAPSNLPQGFDPSLLVTIQPTGMQFLDLAGNPISLPVTFPNTEGLASNNLVDLFSVDHQTGEFIVMGQMQVQGNQIVTISGGLQGGSWHCWCPPPPANNPPGPEGPNGPGCNPNPFVDFNTGFILETFPLPRRTLFDEPWGLDLVYSSARVSDCAIRRLGACVPLESAVPNQIVASAYVGAIPASLPAAFDSSGLNEGTDNPINIPVAIDTSNLATGIHPLTMDVEYRWGAAAAASTSNGSLVVERVADGPFGRGWGLSMDDRIVAGAASPHVALMSGSGKRTVFEDAVISSEDGLFLSMFPDSSDTAVTSFFSGQNALPVEVRTAGGVNLESRWTTPNINFWDVGGEWMLNVGPDGSQQTTNPAMPQGDDTTVRIVGGNDDFGALLEGFLILDQPGSVVFAAFCDDAFALEVDGQLVMQLTGTNPNGFVISPPVTLPQGFVTFRMAYADKGGNSHLILGATGAGLPGSIVPSTSFGAAQAMNVGTTFLGTQGDFSAILQLANNTWERHHPDGTIDTFDTQGRLTQRVDRRGRTTSLVRGAGGEVTSVTDPAGGVTSFSYSGGHCTSVTDPAGRTTQLAYSGVDLTTVTDAANGTWTFGYDAQGLLTSSTDAMSNTNAHQYDALGRYLSTTFADGTVHSQTAANVTNLAFGSSTILPAIPSAATLVATHTSPGGATTTIQEDPIGGVRVCTDALNRVTTTVFDPDTRLPLTITEPDGSRTSFSWDFDRGDLIAFNREGDPNTAVDDRPTQISWAGSNRWITGFRRLPGDPLEQNWSYTLDGNGNPTFVTNPLGQQWEYRYDANNGDALNEVIDAEGRTATFTLDPVTRSTATVVVNGATTTLTRDTAGNVTQVTRPGGASTSYTYDGLNRILTVTDPAGTTTYNRNADGSLASATDAKTPAGVTTFQYDVRGRVTQITDPLNRTETRTYNPDGRLLTRQLPGGALHTYEYDLAGRTTAQRTGVGGLDRYDFVWNDANRVVGAQKTWSGSGLWSDIQFTWNRFGEMLSETVTVPSPTSVVTNTYDKLGRRTSSTVTLGGTQYLSSSFTHDGADRTTSQSTTVSSIGPGSSGTYSFQYDNSGLLTQLGYPGSLLANYTYDGAGMPAGFESWLSGSRIAADVLTSDARNDVTLIDAVDRTLSTPFTNALTYDSTGRLLDETVSYQGGGFTSLNYGPHDGVGNRRAGVWTYDVADQLTGGGPTTTYSYDATGNLTQTVANPMVGTASTTDYTWNAWNELNLIQETVSGSTSIVFSMGYDALGRRRAGGAGRYVHDGRNVVLVHDSFAGEIEAVTHGPGEDQPLAISDSTGTSHLVANAFGSVIQTVRSGTVEYEGTRSAFGSPLQSAGTWPSARVAFGHRGKETHEPVELIYNQARYYQPGTGRFLGREPAYLDAVGGILPMTAHPYLYAGNNPLKYDDPNGENLLLGAAILGGVGLAIYLWDPDSPAGNGGSAAFCQALGGISGPACGLLFPPAQDPSDIPGGFKAIFGGGSLGSANTPQPDCEE